MPALTGPSRDATFRASRLQSICPWARTSCRDMDGSRRTWPRAWHGASQRALPACPSRMPPVIWRHRCTSCRSRSSASAPQDGRSIGRARTCCW